MSFTASVNNTANALGTGSPSISVTPTGPIFDNTNLVPGETVVGSPPITVTNNGDVDVFYYIFADWKEAGTSSPRQAQILADRLLVTIQTTPGGEILFNNSPLSALIDQPTGGRFLASPDSEVLLFSVTLPADTGNVAKNIDLTVDFNFVAQASP
ncbi:MAG: hypothetical protein L5656_08245 [Thermanaeromonas sp.]|uniref:hypothetical protein n=1 Tax=Thermanaeromonas sp. TaxID=2003697 RepID=UPI00243809D0|nr:hypothetical protein [Thermanaeromonas sp.]MCG0278503.1 hypothetical protein [Thermanaeromonas sp.]